VDPVEAATTQPRLPRRSTSPRSVATSRQSPHWCSSQHRPQDPQPSLQRLSSGPIPRLDDPKTIGRRAERATDYSGSPLRSVEAWRAAMSCALDMPERLAMPAGREVAAYPTYPTPREQGTPLRNAGTGGQRTPGSNYLGSSRGGRNGSCLGDCPASIWRPRSLSALSSAPKRMAMLVSQSHTRKMMTAPSEP
jgi:hypothetical protein